MCDGTQEGNRCAEIHGQTHWVIEDSQSLLEHMKGSEKSCHKEI